jgi:hypothetical protein
MIRFVSIVAIGAMLGAPSLGQAQILSTLPPNNGSGGIFMQLTPTTTDLNITAFATYFASVAGSAVSVEVYTRPGPYAGFTGSSAGWTLTQTVSGTSAGTTVLSAPLILTTPIPISAGSTVSIYLHSITTGGGIRYQGTGTTATTSFSNADLAMFTDVSRTGAVAFAGTQFSPRAFSGDIHYQLVPEPASIVTFGLVGGIGLAVRRFRRNAAK